MRQVLLVAALLLVGCDSTPPSGPLVLAGEDQLSGFRTSVGTQIVFGANLVTNDTDSPITDLDVSLGKERAGATVTDVLVREATDYVGAAEWPFEGYEEDSQPLADYTLQPGATVELLVILTVKEEGLWAWPSTTVAYTQKGKDYSKTVTNGLVVCAPAGSACDVMDQGYDEIMELANHN